MERWFDELTHKYLETMRRIHLHCNEGYTPVNLMIAMYKTIKTGELTEKNLHAFSVLIEFNKYY
jgi:hypothetical protein